MQRAVKQALIRTESSTRERRSPDRRATSAIRVELGPGEVIGRLVDGAVGVAFFGGIPYAAPPTDRCVRVAAAATWSGTRRSCLRAERTAVPGRETTVRPELHLRSGRADRPGLSASTSGPRSRRWPICRPERDDRCWCSYTVVRSPADPARPRPMRHRSASGVVLITINFGSGLGFGHLPGAPDNRGLHDQLAALTWIHDQVSAFGGDPDNVRSSASRPREASAPWRPAHRPGCSAGWSARAAAATASASLRQRLR